MKPKSLRNTFLISLLILTGFNACQSDRTSKRGNLTIDDEETSQILDQIETLKQVYHLCPSPAEMLSVIDFEGLNYRPELLNPVDNNDRYIDTRSGTLNLGIYITDLAYSALFGRHEETLDYLKVVQVLAERIRVTGAIDEEMINRARDNVEYLDSLFNISNEAFINMLFFCEKNNRSNTIVLLSAGAFVESLYLAVNMVDKFEGEENLVRHIADQKHAIDNLILFAGSMEDDPNVAATMKDLKPIKDIYDGLETQTASTTIKKDKTNKLQIGGGNRTLISDDQFNQLRKTVYDIREKMVNNSIN